jgi:hypothetical protein
MIIFGGAGGEEPQTPVVTRYLVNCEREELVWVTKTADL